MITQLVNGYKVVVRSASEMGGFPITGKRDAGIIEVYSNGSLVGEEEELIDSAWITISKNGVARLERIK